MAGHFRLYRNPRTLTRVLVRGLWRTLHVCSGPRGTHARSKGTPVWQTLSAIVAGATLALVVAIAAANMMANAYAAPTRYTRDVGIIATTRTKGSWVFHCHNYTAQGINGGGKGTEGVFIATGCLPPTHLK